MSVAGSRLVSTVCVHTLIAMANSDESNNSPTTSLPSTAWLLAVFAAVLGVFGFPVGQPNQTPVPAAKREVPPQFTGEAVIPDCPVGVVLGRVFGNKMGETQLRVDSNPKNRRCSMFGDLPNHLDCEHARLEWLIATVPDPIHSHYRLSCDEVIEAMVRGLQECQFTMVHFSLPWKRRDGRKLSGDLEDQPGAILFRRDKLPQEDTNSDSAGDANKPPRTDYLIVLVVGESPIGGIHREQLEASLELCHHWRMEAACAEREHSISLLGPTFSGSVPGLADLIHDWSATQCQSGATVENPHFHLHIVTGSASSPDNNRYFSSKSENVSITYDAEILDDTVVLSQLQTYLQKERGLRAEEIALLTENTSVYGQSVVRGKTVDDAKKQDAKGGKADQPTQQVAEQRPDDKSQPHSADHTDPPFKDCFQLVYPLSISRIRVESERDGEQQSAQLSDLSTGRQRSLAVKEEVSREAIDLLPTYSEASLAVGDLAVESLITAIRERGIRAVGLLGTDIHDKLFLARKLREAIPDVLLFTTESNLLYTHTDNARMLRGMVIGCSYHLNPDVRLSDMEQGAQGVSENGATAKEAKRSPRDELRRLRQFSSDTAEGTCNATRNLVSSRFDQDPKRSDPQPGPVGWLCVVGNNRLWPLKRIQEDTQPIVDASQTADSADHHVGNGGKTSRKVVLEPWSSHEAVWLPALSGLVLLIGVPLLALLRPPRWGGRRLLRSRAKLWGIASLQWLGLLAVIVVSGMVFLACPGIHNSVLAQWLVQGHSLSAVILTGIVLFSVIPLKMPRNSRAIVLRILGTFAAATAIASWYLASVQNPQSLWAFRCADALNQINSALSIGLLGTAMYVFGAGWKRSQVLLQIFEWTSSAPKERTNIDNSVRYPMWVTSLAPLNVTSAGVQQNEQSKPQWSNNPSLSSGNIRDLQQVDIMLQRKDLKPHVLGAKLRPNKVIQGLLSELGTGSGLILLLLILGGIRCWWNWRRTVEGFWFDICFGAAFGFLVVLLWFGIRNLACISKHVLRDLRAISRIPGLIQCVDLIPARLRNQSVDPILCRRPDPEDEGVVRTMLDHAEYVVVPSRLSNVSEWLPDLIAGRVVVDGKQIHQLEREQKTAVLTALLTIRIREASWHIRNLATTILFVLIVVYLAISSYPFQTSGMLQTTWGVLFVWAVYVMFKTILELNRNETLSILSRTKPNDLTFDRTLFLPLLQYVAIPIIAVFTVANPALGRMLFSWSTVFGSMFRFSGGG